MSLYFNIRANLALSYFVILFFNYLQGLHVLPSSIHFVIFKNSFLLNHENPRDVPHTTGNNMMYTIHSWVFYMHVHCPSCPNTFINLAVQKPMTRVDINDNNQSSNNLPLCHWWQHSCSPYHQDPNFSPPFTLMEKFRAAPLEFNGKV
jgi:hypothetical protein